MFQPIEIFIGLRYVSKRAISFFGLFLSWIPTITIMLDVMVMVVIFSVMNGFEFKLQNDILELIPQAIISSISGSLNPQKIPETSIKLQGIKSIAPLTIGEVIVQSANNLSIGTMLGIEPEQENFPTSYLINVKQFNLEPREYNVVLGRQLSKQLKVNYGDYIRVIVPSVRYLIPTGLIPSQRLFKVVGIFTANSEIDCYQLLVNIQDASHLMHYPDGNITGWRLWLNKPLSIEKLSNQKIPNETKLQDWRERKGELFQAIRMEKNIMGLMLSLIAIISAFNITTSLGVTVIEKNSEIAILKTQGMTRTQIMVIFILQGSCLGTIGVLIGAILGIVVSNYLDNLLSIINIVFDITLLPVLIKPSQVIIIVLSTIVIVVMSILYPSWYATSIKPTKVLSYE